MHPRFALLVFFIATIAIGGALMLRQQMDYRIIIVNNTPPLTPPRFIPDPPVQPKKVRLLAVGDIMLDRSVLLTTQRNSDFSYPFSGTDEWFALAHVRLANLEGPFTDSPSVSVKDSSMRFTFSPKFLQPLAKRVNVVSLANNHTVDFGAKGLAQTKEMLTQAGIAFFGDYNNRDGSLSYTIQQDAITISFIGYHALVGQGPASVLTEISRLDATNDIIIVMPHWGQEYQKIPSSAQRQEAHSFIDAGADIIIGSHPHVIQSIERYQDKLIFYSLGNFIFDQYFSRDTLQGLGVMFEFTKQYDTIGTQATLFPFALGKSRPELANEEERSAILSALALQSAHDPKLSQAIATGTLSL